MVDFSTAFQMENLQQMFMTESQVQQYPIVFFTLFFQILSERFFVFGLQTKNTNRIQRNIEIRH